MASYSDVYIPLLFKFLSHFATYLQSGASLCLVTQGLQNPATPSMVQGPVVSASAGILLENVDSLSPTSDPLNQNLHFDKIPR